jgi:DNA invertase Pin-like site-specific DNA recombinase
MVHETANMAKAYLIHRRGDRGMMACYCRVSTRRQRADSQKADILRWLMSHAVPPEAVQWFEDVDSGTTLKRPAFDRLQQGIFTGTINTVVVWKLDRISRRQREGINYANGFSPVLTKTLQPRNQQ